MTLGSGLSLTAAFNERLQVNSIAASAGGVARASYGFSYCPTASQTSCSGNNGNLKFQTIGYPQTGTVGQPGYEAALSLTQTYGYDALNRLHTAQESGSWQQHYVYDRFGNRALLAGAQYYIPGGSVTPQVTDENSSLGMVAAQFPGNRWSGVVYDGGAQNSVGNVTGMGSYTLGYDAENRQVGSTVSIPGTGNVPTVVCRQNYIQKSIRAVARRTAQDSALSPRPDALSGDSRGRRRSQAGHRIAGYARFGRHCIVGCRWAPGRRFAPADWLTGPPLSGRPATDGGRRRCAWRRPEA
jgi:hypothetical protein